MHVACGNNCTLVLAGGVAFPTLFEMTASVVRGNPRLWEDVGACVPWFSHVVVDVVEGGRLSPSLPPSINHLGPDGIRFLFD